LDEKSASQSSEATRGRDNMRNWSLELRRIILAGISVLGILASLFGSWSCSPKSYSGPVESITLGAQMLEGAIPIFVAQDQGFFTLNGLNVDIKGYDSGLSSLNGMLKGEVDIAATLSEYTVVPKVFEKQPVKIIGSMERLDGISIVARKDFGIESISDLRGKKIGIIPGTNLEFFLGRFLELHGIPLNAVTSVNFSSISQTVDALVGGRVDAIVSVQPFINQILGQIGNNAVVFPAQSGQYVFTLITCGIEWPQVHSNTLVRFMKAINQAEDYINQHPQEAKVIAKKKLDATDDDITRIWSQHQFGLSLDQSLVAAMEDEARWMIKNNLTTGKEVPCFNDYIYEDALKAIKPEAVNIIR
jgi:ABC-type nitrate/sulfonate/bicarbonate transport system substrate-binding protein